MNEQEFKEAIKMIKSSDSMTYEDGYQWLIGFADQYFNRLVELMQEESSPDIRSKLVEVLGHCVDEKVIAVLETELSSEHRDVRFWAHSQLTYFDSSKANEIAEKYKMENPDEDWY